MKPHRLPLLPPPDDFGGDDQLRLSFDEPSPPGLGEPITSVHELDVYDRHGRGYELLIRQDPLTRCVLAYGIRYRPAH